MPKLQKFPMEIIYYDSRAQYGLRLQYVFDVNALFNTHLISNENRPKNQYRIVFIGDSTVRDSTIYPIIDQHRCNGEKLQAYNLGYYGTSVTKDLIILEHAMKYSPDLVVWSVTSQTFSNEPKVFAMANSGDLARLISTYKLPISVGEPLISARSLFPGSNEILMQTRLVINYSVLLPAMKSSRAKIQIGFYHQFDQPETNNLATQETLPGNGDYLFSALPAAQKLAGHVPVILINEPRPTAIVSQQDYERYRKEIFNLIGKQHWTVLDLWNLIPDAGFQDTIHRNDKGEVLFNTTVVPAIINIACSKN